MFLLRYAAASVCGRSADACVHADDKKVLRPLVLTARGYCQRNVHPILASLELNLKGL